MKYLFTYGYKHRQEGRTETGYGSVNMTCTSTDKISEDVIRNAVDWVVRDMAEQGYRDVVVFPLGWFKYEEDL